MTLPRPEPGLVIRYSYLWLSEHREGREEGVKDRPCAVVVALVDADGNTHLTVLEAVVQEIYREDVKLDDPHTR